jgi:glycosyltransferase involved in cell wall biosynthesis
LRQAIESVRAQTHPDIEHVVVDGGSRDTTLAITAEYPNVRLVRAPGSRQSSAVNRGVAEARGEIVVILNADDTLQPTAIATLVAALAAQPQAVAAYGDAVHVDEHGRLVGSYPTRPFDRDALLEACYICHPASAVRRADFLRVGGMDPRLDVVLDYDFWIRLARAGDFVRVDGVLAAARMHPRSKSLSRRGTLYREVIRVLHRHFGYVPYSWTYGYANWLVDRRDQFFSAPRRTKASVALSLVLGLGLNARCPLRFIRDWYRHRAQPGRT